MNPAAPVPPPPSERGVIAWAAALAFAVAWVYHFGFALDALRRVGQHWPLTALHVVLFLIVGGVLFRGLGLPELFRIDVSRPGRLRWLRPFAAAFGAATFIAGSQVAIYFIDLLQGEPGYKLVKVEGWQQPPERLPAFIVLGSVPLVALLLVAAAFPRRARRTMLALAETAVYLGASLAALAAFAFVTWGAGIVIAPEGAAGEADLVTTYLFKNGAADGASLKILSIWVSLAVATAAGLVAVVALRGDLLSPGFGLTLLLSAAGCLYFFTSILKPEYQPVFLLLLAGLIVLSNLAPFRYRYPAMDDADAKDPYAGVRGLSEYSDPTAFGPTRLDEVAVLKAWKARHADRPHLVLLAVSGGAYRAGFWVGAVLDALDADPQMAGLTDNIRIVSGASGGMVGAAYHVALKHRLKVPYRLQPVVETMLKDTGGDSLTRVVRQLLRRDLPFLFWPAVQYQKKDRGIELERHWAALDLPFSALAAGEADGRLPSLVITPTLVETGRPLYISNLRLGWLAGWPEGDDGPKNWFQRQGLELFDLFAAPRFNLQTAVRMNAAFPYASPAVKLPTDPPLRVVDAGYLDNYGLGTAASWLHHHRDWIVRHTTGVTVLVLRAFADSSEVAAGGQSRLSAAFQWASSPMEAAASARGNRMEHQTRELMRLARSSLGAAWEKLKPDERKDAPGFTDLDVIDFAYPGEAAMNWFISKERIEDMQAAVRRDRNAEAWDRLLGRWQRSLATAPTGG